MKIAMRVKGRAERQWKSVEDRNYRNEAHLQRLLYESPDLIPIEEIGEGAIGPRLFITEAGLPGSGNTDLIGVDEAGGITIVECKLATNPDIRRKVIGQVLEYAAYLWEMSYDDFDAIVQGREGGSLAELVRQRMEEEGTLEGWSEEEFRGGVAEALRQGTFRIIVAVDEVTDELRRMIRYLNACGPAGFSIYGLEMHYFADDQAELLVPQLVGMVVRRSTTTSGRKKWDADSFFRESEVSNSAEVVQVMRDLLEFADQEADRVWWGTGKISGSYTFHLLRNDHTVSCFTVYTYGSLSLNLGWARERVSEQLLEEWIKTLRKIPGFRTLREDSLGKWPNFSLARVLSDPVDLDQFKQSVLSFKKAVRGLDESPV